MLLFVCFYPKELPRHSALELHSGLANQDDRLTILLVGLIIKRTNIEGEKPVCTRISIMFEKYIHVKKTESILKNKIVAISW